MAAAAHQEGVMRLPRLFPNASTMMLLTSFLLLSHVVAQNLPDLPDASDEESAAATTSDSEDARTTDDAQTTDEANSTDQAESTDRVRTTERATRTSNTASETDMPAISATSDTGALTGLPKLYTNAPLAVPPTADAPFMQKSNLPEGTVFIAVGAGLGFIAFVVLAWRGFMAWSINRSVKRAAIASTRKYAGKDPLEGLKTKGPYKSPGPGSTLSLDKLSAGGKVGSRRASAHNNLFFSPTAGAGMNSPSNRGSGYLPAGYYASGNSALAGGAGMAQIGGGSRPISKLGVDGYDSPRRMSTARSPPRSPSLPTSRGGDSIMSGRRLSTQGLVGQPTGNTLNLSVPPQGRAPSAYLEDLISSHTPGSPGHSPVDERRSSRRF